MRKTNLVRFLFLVFTIVMLRMSAFADVSITVTGVSSAGGIVYLHTTAQITGCFELTTNYAGVIGTNIYVTFNGRERQPCILQFPPQTYTKTNTTVLGPLASGSYSLRIYAPNPDDFGSSLDPQLRYIIMPFNISNDPSAQTFTINSAATNSNFGLSVAGVSGARYIVDMSTNLIDWVPVFTNVGGPFNFTTPYDRTQTNCIYRTRILSSQ